MLRQMDKGKVIGMKLAGMSNREIHRQEGYGRDKISEVWSEYTSALGRMKETGADIKAIQEEMYSEPKYDSSKRTKRKYTAVVEEALKEILEQEEAKTRRLGPRHKQKLTNKQIHEQLVVLGHDIGRVTINNAIAMLRRKLKEVYVRRHYDFGDRLEYDFGEVLLDCGKGIRKYHPLGCASATGRAVVTVWRYCPRRQATSSGHTCIQTKSRRCSRIVT